MELVRKGSPNLPWSNRRRISVGNRSMGQEEILDFIALIHQHTCLWHIDKASKNMLKKNQAWAKIAAEMGEPVEFLKKKWRNMTIQFYSNRKSYYLNLAENPSADPPIWFAYEPMSFLNEAHQRPKLEEFNITSEMQQTEESSTEQTSPSPPPPARSPPPTIASQRQVGSSRNKWEQTFPSPPPPALSPPPTIASRGQTGLSRKRKNAVQKAHVADSLTSLERSLDQVVAVVSKRNKYEGIGQFVADTLAENDGSRIGNAELCSKIFSICALATKKSPRHSIIRGITDKLEQCDNDKFESIRNIIRHMLDDDDE